MIQPYGSPDSKRIVIHPGYNSATSTNNVALVKNVGYGSCEANCGDDTPPILLDIDLEGLEGMIGYATSWDFTDSDPDYFNGAAPTDLTMGELTIQEGGVCEGIYGRTHFRDEDHICGYGYKKPYRTCYLDSGSALYIEHEIGRNVLVGIAPYWDSKCRTRHTPSTYGRISGHIDWIKSVVGEQNLILASDLIRDLEINKENEILDLVIPLL